MELDRTVDTVDHAVRVDTERERLLGTGPPESPQATAQEMVGTGAEHHFHSVARLLEQRRSASEEDERTRLAVELADLLERAVHQRRVMLGSDPAALL